MITSPSAAMSASSPSTTSSKLMRRTANVRVGIAGLAFEDCDAMATPSRQLSNVTESLTS